MTDRELLELAAKAAGEGPVIAFVNGALILGPASRSREWNPLTSDGDALRLAVKLGLLVDADKSIEASEAWSGGVPFVREDWPRHPDPYAATRRAIVRAAAEIGRAMP